MDEAALAAHCRRELAAYKVPRLIAFVNEADLPLTVTGKLQKNRLQSSSATRQPTRGRDGRVPAWRIPPTCSAKCRAGTRSRMRSTGSTRSSRRSIGFDPARDEVESWTPPEKLGSFAPSAGGGLIIAGRNGFALYDPRSGSFARIADPENKAAENILNDGRCDSARPLLGRLDDQDDAARERKTLSRRRAAASMRATTASGCRTASPGARTTRRCISPTATCTRSSSMTTISIPARSASAACSPTRSDRAGVPDGASVDAEGYPLDRDVRRRHALRATRRTDGSTAPCRCRSAARPPARSAAPISPRCM